MMNNKNIGGKIILKYFPLKNIFFKWLLLRLILSINIVLLFQLAIFFNILRIKIYKLYLK